MRREGCTSFFVSTVPLTRVEDIYKCNYNVVICTNKTIKHPYAHRHKSRSNCSLCTNSKKAGKYKRKQFKHEINKNKHDFENGEYV